MYSMGCLIYAVHNKGSPPFRNHNSPASLRDNLSRGFRELERADPELKGSAQYDCGRIISLTTDLLALLSSLITRHALHRPTPETLPSHPFFSSLSISTLNFLERSTFASKTREEKITFMKGLTGVLDRFSEGLKTRKILPSLVEEVSPAAFHP